MYTKQWGGPHPGCIIFLLDQSGSMVAPFGAGQPNRGERKCDMVAAVLNGFLQELILTNTLVRPDATTEVRPRADIAVIGYEGGNINSALGGSLSYQPFVSLPELQADPVKIERFENKEIDPRTGMEVQRTIEVPIWVRPKAGGGTPMCAALQRAKELASQWVASHPDNYPPVVINVTDGQSTDGDPTQLASELRQISTSDGQTLLFNVHITETKSMPVYYPASESDLMGDKFARLLFSMSSEIPESIHGMLAQSGTFLQPGARGMIFNGDATSVRQMFQFGTLAATTPLDPNM
jgi:hypothetical protein